VVTVAKTRNFKRKSKSKAISSIYTKTSIANKVRSNAFSPNHKKGKAAIWS
jgi:hypothetical protein